MLSNPSYISVKKGTFGKWSIEIPSCKIFNFLFFFPKSPLHVRFSFFFNVFFPKSPPISRWGRFLTPRKCLCSPLVILFCSFQVDVIIHIPTDKFFYFLFFFQFCTSDSEKKTWRHLKVKELFSPSNGVVGLKIIVLLRAVTRTKNLLRKRLLYIVFES